MAFLLVGLFELVGEALFAETAVAAAEGLAGTVLESTAIAETTVALETTVAAAESTGLLAEETAVLAETTEGISGLGATLGLGVIPEEGLLLGEETGLLLGEEGLEFETEESLFAVGSNPFLEPASTGLLSFPTFTGASAAVSEFLTGITFKGVAETIITAAVSAAASEEVVRGILEVFDELRFSGVFDHTGMPRDPTKPFNSLNFDAYQVGLDLGHFLSYNEKYLSKGFSEEKAMLQVIQEHPELTYLFGPVYNYDHETQKMPVSELMKMVKDYNGNGLTQIEKVENGITLYGVRDEKGSEKYYRGKRYPNNPTVHGVYCGAFSPNNFPAIDYIDLVCESHDIQYDDEGYFSFFADLKLVERLRSRMSTYSPVQKLKAASMIKYFSTMGYTLSLFKKQLPGYVDKKVIGGSYNDIFFQLSKLQDPVKRMRFYKGLRKGLEQEQNMAEFGDVDSNSCKLINQKLLQIPVSLIKV